MSVADDACQLQLPPLVRKDFIWDQAVKVAMSSLLLAAALGATIEHFRGDKAVCPVLTDSNLNASNVSCNGDKHYFLLFVILHAMMTLAPHYVWYFVFRAYMDTFFGWIRKLDPMQSLKICHTNGEIADFVNKVEIESLSKHKQFFFTYKVKLALQFVFSIATIVIILAYFDKFSLPLKCLTDSSSVSLQEDITHPLRFSICSAPFPLLSFLRTVAMALVCLCIVMLLCGFTWCILGHPTELGSEKAAIFTFLSCLPPEQHTFPYQPYYHLPLYPKIQSDLDFMMMQLVWSDGVRGHVLRRLLVHSKCQELSKDFIQLLDKLDTYGPDVIHGAFQCENIKHFVYKYGFTGSPEVAISQKFGDITFAPPTQSVRDILYGFFQLAPDNNVALDISFGTVGCALPLAMAFRSVLAVGFYALQGYPAQREVQANICTVRLPIDALSQNAKVTNEINKNFTDDFIKDKSKEITMVMVGPILEQSCITKASLLIDRFYTAKFITKKAVLLAIRPLRIGNRDTTHQYFSYRPPEEWEVMRDEDMVQTAGDKNTPPVRGYPPWLNEYRHLSVQCDDTECILEIGVYRFMPCVRYQSRNEK